MFFNFSRKKKSEERLEEERSNTCEETEQVEETSNNKRGRKQKEKDEKAKSVEDNLDEEYDVGKNKTQEKKKRKYTRKTGATATTNNTTTTTKRGRKSKKEKDEEIEENEKKNEVKDENVNNIGKSDDNEEKDNKENKDENYEMKITEELKDKDAKASALTLEILGDIPDADMKPPENILFVCKLNPVTEEEDLKIIFSRFGNIKSCKIIKDKVTNNSLQYGFIEFEKKEDCLNAYFEMDNVVIDDRRIHVDFCQSLSKYKNEYLKDNMNNDNVNNKKQKWDEATCKKEENNEDNIRVFKYESDHNTKEPNNDRIHI